MPQLVFDPLGGLNSFIRQMPIPTLNSYITLSILLSSASFYYVHNLFGDKEVCFPLSLSLSVMLL